MGWKVRSGKLTKVKQKGGTTQQVRFAIAKYKIKQALAVSGKALEDGLDIADFQELAQNGILICDDPKNLQIGEMKELKKQKFSLEEIRDYFIKKYNGMDLKCFIDTYLNTKDDITTSTLNRFMGGKEAIKEEAFKTICNVLELDHKKIGMNETKIPEYHKELESLLWQLNHTQQSTRFKQLAKDSHNLVCLKFSQVPETKIPIYWLIQTLVQPFDDSLEKFTIELNSGIESNYKKGLNKIVEKLKLHGKLKEKKNPDAIANEIHKKMLKKKETTVLLFLTEEGKYVSDCDELVNNLYKALEKLFVKQKPPQKLLMVWIDLQASSQSESNAVGDDGNDSIYNEIFASSKFNRNDIIDWTICDKVKLFMNETIKLSSDDPSFETKISKIWDESEEGKPECLLKSFYSLFNLELEYHQSVWQDKL
ncbi:hypothetical protein QUB68_18345 [Microcoleus sp. A006_D1]|uniref:hypothetical protein n=1 Tax=Microcoleus sp. A006_D1 TaxID=3055267 RepID=UPI002FD513A2